LRELAAASVEANAELRVVVPPPVAAGSPWLTFSIASIAVFLVSLDVTVLYAAFPALRAGFPAASAGDLSWVLNAYTVVYAALLVPAGRFADLRGRKRAFLGGLALFLAASLACGLAPTVGVLVVARTVQAIGAALLLPASLSLVLSAFPPDRRAIAVSLWGAVSGLAAAIGPSVGSLLVDHLGWPFAFFLNLPFGLVALVRGARSLDESKNAATGAPIDVPGVVLLVAGVGAIALGLVRSESLAWSSPGVAGSLVAGLAMLAAFVAWARRAPAPAIDLTLFQDRTYRWINAATLVYGIAFAMMFFSIFQFATGVWHYSLSRAGLAASPGPLLVVPTALVCGRIAVRRGHRNMLIAGALVFGAGCAWLAVGLDTEPAYLTGWLPGMILTGLGVGMVMPSLSAAAVAHLAPARFGVGSAVNQATRQIGAVLGVALAVALAGRAHASVEAFQHLFWWQAALAVGVALLCVPVDTRPRGAQSR
jgi:EmrB/QacA subfamily drug resistance transporter